MNISIEHLSKSYGLQKAVDDISFEVRTGEILGFLGPNGAGKTTTMKMLTQYIDMDGGRILVDGRPLQELKIKNRIGYLPEHNPLYEDMPVMDYLPEILILDEPTTGLDPNQIVEIRELIKELGQEKTVILSTHILPEVEATCDRILIINQGKIVADGTAANLRKKAQGQQIIKVRIEDGDPTSIQLALAHLPSVANAEKIANTTDQYEVQSYNDLSPNRDVFNLCAEKRWVITEMIPIETKLEDIFRDLTMN